MNKMRMLAIFLVAVLLMNMTPALAASRPTIGKQPQNQTVEENGTCTLSAYADGCTGITWRFCNADGSVDEPFTNAVNYFSGLKFTGKNNHNLKLENIPAAMNGWYIYCRYTNKAGRSETNKVTITVTDKTGLPVGGNAISAPDVEQESSAGRPVGSEKILTAYNCTFQFLQDNGKAGGEAQTMLNFSKYYTNPVTGNTCPGGLLNCKVSAQPDEGMQVVCWVINGVRYYFDEPIDSFTIYNLSSAMNVEAIYAAAPAAASKNAMQVTADIPEGSIITGWKFNEATLYFNTYVTHFAADNVYKGMVYEPLYAQIIQ